MKDFPFQARQGDVLIVAEAAPEGGEKVARENGGVVLAHGEATGHAHQLRSSQVSLYQQPETKARHLRVVETSYLQHEEHAKIAIPPGTHRVLRQAQWTDQDEPIFVAD